jgi:hypothetical protein
MFLRAVVYSKVTEVTLLHIVKIPTFYLRRYGQNCPYCRKIEEIYKKKNHVAR